MLCRVVTVLKKEYNTQLYPQSSSNSNPIVYKRSITSSVQQATSSEALRARRILICLGAGVLSVDSVLAVFTNVFVSGYRAKLIEVSMITLLSAILQRYGRTLY